MTIADLIDKHWEGIVFLVIVALFAWGNTRRRT